MGRMDGKVALVTGAARGIGRASAVLMAREGAKIVGFDCPGQIAEVPYEMGTPEELAQTVAAVQEVGGQMIAVHGDVRSQSDLDQAVSRGVAEFGHLDVCVANAGVWSHAEFWEFEDAEWAAIIDICLSGAWRTAKAVAPQMIQQRAGSIVFVSSTAACEGAEGLSHYAAAKHGVTGLMKSICLGLGPRYGVRCNAVLPGTTDTDIIKWPGGLDYMAGGEGLGSLDILTEGCKTWSALENRGLISPEGQARAVLFLASDDAADITGVEIRVDNGHMILPGLNHVVLGAQTIGTNA